MPKRPPYALIALRNFAVSWLLGFVIAWKLTHDRALALAGATVLAAALVLFLAVIERKQ
jgi:hypothetical protein